MCGRYTITQDLAESERLVALPSPKVPVRKAPPPISPRLLRYPVCSWLTWGQDDPETKEVERVTRAIVGALCRPAVDRCAAPTATAGHAA